MGGIFPSLFAAFFFMKIFGLYFFEMAFAHEHFRCKETEQHNFSHFLKRNIYNFFKSLGFEKKSWKIAKKQAEITQTINKLLEISYLFRRIEFLEKAITLLLDDYQLKGIYLSQVSINQANKDYKKHRFRDRLIRYLHKKNI